jgi:Mg2+ and Co2+ transporter CorA
MERNSDSTNATESNFVAPAIIVSQSTPTLFRSEFPSNPSMRQEENGVRQSTGSSTGSISYQKISDCFDGLLPESKRGYDDSRARFMLFTRLTGPLYGSNLSNIRLSHFNHSISELLQKEAFWIDIVDPTHEEMLNIQNVEMI